MPDLGIFEDDKFSLSTLTASVNEAPTKPRHLAKLELFEEEPIRTTAVQIEKQADNLTLVENSARGGSGAPTTSPSRNLVTLNTSHLETTTPITADDVQNIREFGYASELDAVEAYVQRLQSKKKKRIEATVEYQRVGAIKGLILDSDGTTVLENIYQKFGMTQQVHEVSIGKDAPADVFISQLLGGKHMSEDALGDAQYDGWRVLSGRNFFTDLIVTKDVKEAWMNWQKMPPYAGEIRNGFNYGDVIWDYYSGGIGGVPFIDPEEAYLVPEGVDEFLKTVFAPADYMETVNTEGLPFYSKQWEEPNGKSITLENQSNPMSFSTRPRAIIKLVKKGAAPAE